MAAPSAARRAPPLPPDQLAGMNLLSQQQQARFANQEAVNTNDDSTLTDSSLSSQPEREEEQSGSPALRPTTGARSYTEGQSEDAGTPLAGGGETFSQADEARRARLKQAEMVATQRQFTGNEGQEEGGGEATQAANDNARNRSGEGSTRGQALTSQPTEEEDRAAQLAAAQQADARAQPRAPAPQPELPPGVSEVATKEANVLKTTLFVGGCATFFLSWIPLFIGWNIQNKLQGSPKMPKMESYERPLLYMFNLFFILVVGTLGLCLFLLFASPSILVNAVSKVLH